jgi:alanine racemase
MFRRTFAEVNLDHLKHNVRLLQQAFSPHSFMCVMVKANAYGHGDVPISRYLEFLGVKHLGVCLIEEGLILRRGGVLTDILVFRGFDRDGAKTILENKMTPVVSSWEQISHLEAVAKSPVHIHIKFDTGMNRLGFHPDEGQKLFDYLWQNKKIRLQAILTHLFNGEDGIHFQGQTSRQLQKLNKLTQLFKPLNIFSHALNSAGVASALLLKEKGEDQGHPLSLQDWGLRPGLMVYGYNPLGDRHKLQLKPVMSLKSQIGMLRSIRSGETVSYGGTWQAKRDSIIGVVPIGYADGYHRLLSNRAEALFAGKRVQIVGNVCMDYLMIDVTDVVAGHDVSHLMDQEVTLFGFDSGGEFLSPEELADRGQTISWEILTSIGERVPRIYKGQDAQVIQNNLGENQ